MNFVRGQLRAPKSDGYGSCIYIQRCFEHQGKVKLKEHNLGNQTSPLSVAYTD